MDLLNIQEGTAASRPSLISSLWSLQVQLQNEPSITTEDVQLTGGSKQSLPDMIMNDCEESGEPMEFNHFCHNHQSHLNFRSVKSLSDLNSLAMIPSTSAIQISPLCGKDLRECQLEEEEGRRAVGAVPLSSRLKSSSLEQEQQQYHAMLGLSRQQKNNNICQWLQKLDIGSNSGSRDTVSMEESGCKNNIFNK